ncbi:MAG: exo-alpha-sialidase [Actinobacteria bacterium]|nr:exo-alpha-sialidase [Actinomycetota bacterium]
MKRLIPLIIAITTLALVTTPTQAAGNARVTRDAKAGTYLRYDGTSDATTSACSTSRRSQNEPAVAVDPHNTNVVTAGSNDYCAALVNGDAWAGFYRSTNGGTSWQDSLVPGYPADTSAAGMASPAHAFCNAAGDPTQSFDNAGRLFYGFICFNRSQPQNGSTFVATYGSDGAHYVRTALVDKGTPSGNSAGLFEDKINLAVDQTNGPSSGNVYVAWAQFAGFAPNDRILFSRSTDHGKTFSAPISASPEVVGAAQFADLAVGPDGTVYLTYRTFTFPLPGTNAIWLQRSTDGGVSWSAPVQVAGIAPFDSSQFSGNGTGDCGDGPFSCPTGLTFERFSSLSAVAADSTGVHVVWNAETANGQAKIFARSSPDGISWPTDAASIDSVATGHQWFPDIASSGGVITVVFYDSRADAAYAPGLPPGNTAGGTSSGGAVDTLVAESTDGGATWTESLVSTVSSNFDWETHGRMRIPFWGDYIYVSSVDGRTNVAWTDSRNLVAGSDPRETGSSDDQDGFDGYQTCTWDPNDINAPSYSSPSVSDPCLSQGGLDQNIYGMRV